MGIFLRHGRATYFACLAWCAYLVVWTYLLVSPVEIPENFPGAGFFRSQGYLIAKTVHVLGYAAFTGLAWWAGRTPPRWWTHFTVVVLHGPATEWIQDSFPALNRTGRLVDVVFDWVGVALGLGLAGLVRLQRRRRRERLRRLGA
jgi:hypothetical protein